MYNVEGLLPLKIVYRSRNHMNRIPFLQSQSGYTVLSTNTYPTSTYPSTVVMRHARSRSRLLLSMADIKLLEWKTKMSHIAKLVDKGAGRHISGNTKRRYSPRGGSSVETIFYTLHPEIPLRCWVAQTLKYNVVQ